MTMASLCVAWVNAAQVLSPMKAGIFQLSTENAISSRVKLIL